ncbi:hypothetical protein [Dactylosporangium maewongense]|uniref:hypothetical protein n=1 Tax=Dactylosporangium maewongense TaxID=634393 RepID=UPI0031CF85DE
MSSDARPGWLRRTEAEQRWPAALAIAVAVAVHLLLPADLAPRRAGCCRAWRRPC